MSLTGQNRAGDDAGLRALLDRIGRLEAGLRTNAAALGGLQGLIETQESLAAQVAFLSGQTQYAEMDSALYTYVSGPQFDYIVPWSPTESAAIDVTTSSTGRLLLDAACVWSISLDASVGPAFHFTMYVEIMQGATVVKGYADRTPRATVADTQHSDTSEMITLAGSLNARGVLTLDPDTDYTARVRFIMNGEGSGNNFRYEGVSLITTKLGM